MSVMALSRYRKMIAPIAASPNGVVKGRGVQPGQLSFGLLVFPSVWDWYLQWREQRRGFYTKWEEDMLTVAQAFTPDVVQQHDGLFLPQDKAVLAAKILNQVWEMA